MTSPRTHKNHGTKSEGCFDALIGSIPLTLFSVLPRRMGAGAWRTPGQLSSTASSLTFGNVNVGSSGTQSVMLTNSGGSNVSISNVTISGAGFSVNGISIGLILGPGASATMNVVFAPAASGSVTGSVTITSTASNSPLTISLSGTGIVVAHSATLNWTASTSIVVGYNVYRGTTSGGPYTRLNSSVNVPTTYIDSSVVSGQTYYYVDRG